MSTDIIFYSSTAVDIKDCLRDVKEVDGIPLIKPDMGRWYTMGTFQIKHNELDEFDHGWENPQYTGGRTQFSTDDELKLAISDLYEEHGDELALKDFPTYDSMRMRSHP